MIVMKRRYRNATNV